MWGFFRAILPALALSQETFTQLFSSKIRFPDGNSRQLNLPATPFSKNSQMVKIDDEAVLFRDVSTSETFWLWLAEAPTNFTKLRVQGGDVNDSPDCFIDAGDAVDLNDNLRRVFTRGCTEDNNETTNEFKITQWVLDGTVLQPLFTTSSLVEEQFGPVIALAQIAPQIAFVATSKKLLYFNLKSSSPEIINEFFEPVTTAVLKSHLYDSTGKTYFHMATDQGFNTTYFWLDDILEIEENDNLAFDWEWDWTLQVTDGLITDFDYQKFASRTSDNLGKIMTVDVAAVNVRYTDGTWWRMGSTKQGVPFANATSVGVVDWGKDQAEQSLTARSLEDQGLVAFVGTKSGVFYLEDGSASPWRVLEGYRWLLGNNVETLKVLNGANPGALVKTEHGLSWITRNTAQSFADKSDQVLEVYNSGRHGLNMLGPEHPMHGLVSQIGYPEFGNPAKNPSQGPSDNDGLWTAMLLAAESFRYSVTGDERAKVNADHMFNGTRLLQDVTGQRGLLARCISTSGSGEKWHKWQPNEIACDQCEQLWWKSTISQDSIIGQMFVDPIYAELVASEGEKESVIQLFLDIVDRIVENGYTMPDYDGIPTKWGHWDPYSVNQDMDRYSERGLNSLQILTYLSAAEVLVKKYGMTAKNDYMAHFDNLYNKENYKRNLGNVKLQATSEDNYSDDEQQFLAYYLFYFTVLRNSHLSNAETIAVFKNSLYKTWKHVSYSENSVMAGVALAMLGDDFSAADKDFTKNILVKDLVRMPISQVTWDFDATPGINRKDMYLDPNIDRWGDVGSHVTIPIPKDEQAYLQWNADPFMFSGSGGNREYPGTLYLLPYWLARYQNILST